MARRASAPRTRPLCDGRSGSSVPARLAETLQGYGEDAPARTLMFPGDVPKLDDPLPRRPTIPTPAIK